jgi:serine/threonine-protein kinase HipA
MRRARVLFQDKIAGILSEDEHGFHFQYEELYLKDEKSLAISLTLPLTDIPYESKMLFPFFDGLIPEGWLLNIAQKNWKINPRDRMGILLKTCTDCIGAVSIIEIDG